MPLDPSEIAPFLDSFAACLYCALLSRRLKALQNTKDGLGASIRAMSESVAAVSSAKHEAQAQSGDMRGEPARSLGALLQGLAAKHYERGEAKGGNAGRRMMDRGIACQQLARAMEERLWNAEAGNSSLLVIHRGGGLRS